ncbi:uncharacterized protein [Procambarus clarkii]|uniref:uncharacterized protein n=1 Tax=Procambarus clarkii TaxID=6728 RepID=UPI00374252BB
MSTSSQKHEWDLSPDEYLQLGGQYFCYRHSKVWCKQCKVPIDYCSADKYREENIQSCADCKLDEWLSDLFELQKYADQNDTRTTENRERILHLSKIIPDSGDKQQQENSGSDRELVPETPNRTRVSETVDTSDSPVRNPEWTQHSLGATECEQLVAQESISRTPTPTDERKTLLTARRALSKSPSFNTTKRNIPTPGAESMDSTPSRLEEGKGETPCRSKSRSSSIEKSHLSRILQRPNKRRNRRSSTSPSPKRHRHTNPYNSDSDTSIEWIEETDRQPRKSSTWSLKEANNRKGHTANTNGGNKLELTDDSGRHRRNAATTGEDKENDSTPNTPKRTTSRPDEMDGRRLEKDTNDKQMEETYYTFVTRTKPKPRGGAKPPSFIMADHNDHWHITFRCTTNNLSRQRKAILNYLGLTGTARLEATASTILVQMLKKWILYLIRYGVNKLHYFGFVSAQIKNIIRYFTHNKIPSDEIDGPCPYMEKKRQERKPKTNKNNEYEFILEMIEKHNVISVNDLLHKQTQEEFALMYKTLGTGYKDKIRSILAFTIKKKQQESNAQPVMIQLQKTTRDTYQDRNFAWLKYLFQKNNINIVEFLSWFIMIADKRFNKINTLVIEGPTGTGKTLTLGALLNTLNTGTITRGGDNNQFHFQNLLNRNFALFEEPRINHATMDEYKLLLEGSTFEINVKNSDMEPLKRIPIFISTNKPIDYWVAPADGAALQSRTKTFQFNIEIKGMSDRMPAHNSLDPPPGRITTADFLYLYYRNKQKINEFITVSINYITILYFILI